MTNPKTLRRNTLDEIATLVGLEDKLDDAEVEKMAMFLSKVEGSAYSLAMNLLVRSIQLAWKI
jgi:hypothetical protein